METSSLYNNNNEYLFENKSIKEHLIELAKNDYKQFSQKLNPGVDNVLGIRVPQLRELAKKISKDNWQAFLDNADTYYMEERMLIGFVIGNIKMDNVDEYLKLVDSFVSIINSWSVCDTFDFYGKDRFVRKNEKRIWNYLLDYMHKSGEYQIRFGVVMSMSHFITDDYVKALLHELNEIKHDGYYVKMAVAWAVSVAYVKYPDITYSFLKNNNLDDFTQNKAIQKITESFRATSEQKNAVRLLKRTAKI